MIKNEKFSNEQRRKPDLTQEKFLADIVNKVRAKDQHTTSILPRKLTNPKWGGSINFKFQTDIEQNPFSKFTALDLDSDPEE